MFNYFGQFLYHVLIVLCPILFFHLFLRENHTERKKSNAKFVFIILFMLFCTMSHPIEYKEGYYYDFRIIPILIAFLYGGLVQGWITTFMMLAYRLFIGGAGFQVTLINYTILSTLILLVYRHFETSELKKKLMIISFLYWFIAATRALTLYQTQQFEQLPFMMTFSLLTWLTLITVFFIIESLDQQMKIQQQLQRADKLNVISQLAASVAHEVRNPMTSVRGFLQLMSSSDNLDDKQQKYIQISLKELEHAQSIINDYLSLARPNDKNPSLIHLSEEINQTVELMTSYTNINNVKIESYIEEQLYVKGLKAEVKQVLVNIMKNGIESMENGGTIAVKANRVGSSIVIQISDQGKGMNRKMLKSLGTPFYSTKDKGTGVGLTVSYQIIHNMKGRIQVESEEGKGTTFTIHFPITPLVKSY
jgi:two-component system, sporulation sensor kinase B